MRGSPTRSRGWWWSWIHWEFSPRRNRCVFIGCWTWGNGGVAKLMVARYSGRGGGGPWPFCRGFEILDQSFFSGPEEVLLKPPHSRSHTSTRYGVPLVAFGSFFPQAAGPFVCRKHEHRHRRVCYSLLAGALQPAKNRRRVYLSAFFLLRLSWGALLSRGLLFTAVKWRGIYLPRSYLPRSYEDCARPSFQRR